MRMGARLDKLTPLKNRLLSRFLRYFPGLVRRWARNRSFASREDTPWTPLRQPLTTCRVALVTTAGVHLRSQPPFDMQNPLGDPSFREIPASVTPEQLTITHDYYDHRDADRDINIVFPITRLQEFAARGEVGEVSPVHLGFMGHVDGDLVSVLQQQTAPAAAALLLEQQVDVVLLFPA
jgi:D-proline reductase (dithiol) PrdB